MRNLFLLLILLNLMVLSYQRWILAPGDSENPGATDSSIPMLQLAASPIVAEAVETTQEPDAENAEPRCMRLGPFASRDAAVAVQRDLRKRGALVSESSAEGQVWVGHWVQVPNLASRAAAEEARAQLSASDLDTYILPDAESHSLSLGIYRKRASAERLVRTARQLGYKTLIVDRFQPGTIFWLRVNMPFGGALQPGEFQGDSGQILRTESISCD